MNKSLIITILAILIVFGGVGVYFLMANKNALPSVQISETSNSVTDTPQNLTDLMNFASNKTCTFTDTTSNSSGTVFVANKKVRGDFNSAISGKTMMSHMIIDSNNVYIWTDGESEGYKTSFEAITEVQSQMSDAKMPGINTTPDFDEKVDLKCQDWNADQTKFTPPSSVKFTDYSEMMKNLKDTGSQMMQGDNNIDVKAIQCQSCENLPADSKAACKSALGCI